MTEPVLVLCPRCTGGGWVASAAVCPECLGSPYVNLDGNMLVCQHCHGTGRANVRCPQCGGSGMVAPPPPAPGRA